MRTTTIVDCKNGHVFRLGLNDDGFRDCPDCGELLSNPKQGTNALGTLTIGQAWRNKRKVERMQSKEGCHWGDSISRSEASKLSITVDIGTDKMQMKLRAIACHAESLADELDAIDKKQPCECGSYDTTTVKGGTIFMCFSCEKEEELSTRLEGSD